MENYVCYRPASDDGPQFEINCEGALAVPQVGDTVWITADKDACGNEVTGAWVVTEREFHVTDLHNHATPWQQHGVNVWVTPKPVEKVAAGRNLSATA